MATFQDIPDKLRANIIEHLDIHSTARFFKTSKALRDYKLMRKAAEDKPLAEQIVCSSESTMLLDKLGRLYACGHNGSGQLGLGNNVSQDTFTRVELAAGIAIQQVVCGWYHTMLLDKIGGLYACGDNKYGQLGLGDKVSHNTFTRVNLPSGIAIQQVVFGSEHTMLLDKNGGVYACGVNRDGQLGLSHNVNRNTFERVDLPASIEIQQVVCGSEHTMLLDKNGGVYACGHNEDGQLGLADNNNRNAFTRVELPAGIEIQQVVCGAINTVLLDKNGGVYACGHNEDGQLGLADNNDRNTFTPVELLDGVAIAQVTFGCTHTMLLDKNGIVYACGWNKTGQLGLGDNDNRNTFTRVNLLSGIAIQQVVCGEFYTMLLDKDGRVYVCDSNGAGQQNTFTRVELAAGIEIQDVVCGNYYAMLLDKAGSVYTCGESGYRHRCERVQEGLPRWEWKNVTQHNTASCKRRLENDRPLEEASSGLGL